MNNWEYLDRTTDLADLVMKTFYGDNACIVDDTDGITIRKSKVPENSCLQTTQEVILPNIYQGYDMFCLTTKMERLLHRYNLSWYPRIVLFGYHDAVRVYQGNDFVPLRGEEYNLVNDMMKEAVTEDEGYCLLLHSDRAITYRGVCFTQPWLASMLLTIPVKDTVTYQEFPDLKVVVDAYYKDGAIYVKLDGNYSYKKVYQDLYISLLDTLYYLWIRGSILLDPKIDANFIKKWQLLPELRLAPLHEGEKRKVYYPNWSNHWLAPVATEFLLERRSGVSTIRVRPGDRSDIKRHYIANSLRNLIIVFSGDYVIVEIDDYQEAEYAHYKIMEAISNMSGNVFTDIVPSSYRNMVEYRDLSRGLIRSYLV